MTDTTKPVEPPERIWAWPHYDFRGWYAGGCSTEPLMDGTQCTEYVPATALDAANAEIERLKLEAKAERLVLKALKEKAEADVERLTKERDHGTVTEAQLRAKIDRLETLVAAAYEAAAITGEKYAECCPSCAGVGNRIRAKTPADATAALEARDARIRREGWEAGMKEAAEISYSASQPAIEPEAEWILEEQRDNCRDAILIAIKEQQP